MTPMVIMPWRAPCSIPFSALFRVPRKRFIKTDALLAKEEGWESDLDGGALSVEHLLVASESGPCLVTRSQNWSTGCSKEHSAGA